MMIKRLISAVLVLILLCSGALAQDTLIEGEFVLDEGKAAQMLGDTLANALMALEGDLTIENGEGGFYAQLGENSVHGLAQEGRLLLTTDKLLENKQGMRVTIAGGNVFALLNAWLDAQGLEVAQSNAVYSSLFTRSVSVEVTVDMLSPVLVPWVEEMFPLLYLLGVNTAALQQTLDTVQPGAVWGQLTRYKGDEKQYPDLSLLTMTLNIPGMPHVYLWLRSDEFGTSLRLGVEAGEVLDWDETLLILEDGGSDTGFVVNAFTLLFEDDEELNTYIEAAVTIRDQRIVLECDHYLSYTEDYLWALELILREETRGEVAGLWLEAMPLECAQTADLTGLTEISLSEYLRTIQK